MSELHRQQEEDRNELALTNPDDAKDAQADALREELQDEYFELSEIACNQGHDCDFPLQEPDF